MVYHIIFLNIFCTKIPCLPHDSLLYSLIAFKLLTYFATLFPTIKNSRFCQDLLSPMFTVHRLLWSSPGNNLLPSVSTTYTIISKLCTSPTIFTTSGLSPLPFTFILTGWSKIPISHRFPFLSYLWHFNKTYQLSLCLPLPFPRCRCYHCTLISHHFLFL